MNKHVRVLEEAGLVRRRKLGRTTFLALDRTPIRALQAWLAQFHAYWGTDKETLENYEPYLASDTNREGDPVKKFLVLFHDRWEPKPEIMAAWQAWFAKVGDRFVDSGNPFGVGFEVTRAGSRELSGGDGAATGYSIISAESREEAERLLEGLPVRRRASASTRRVPCSAPPPAGARPTTRSRVRSRQIILLHSRSSVLGTASRSREV